MCTLFADTIHLFKPTILGAKPRVARAEIVYARRTLCASHLIVKRDFASMVTCIQEYPREIVDHPRLQDISILLSRCAAPSIRHIFREVNIVIDRVVAFVIEYSSSIRG